MPAGSARTKNPGARSKALDVLAEEEGGSGATRFGPPRWSMSSAALPPPLRGGRLAFGLEEVRGVFDRLELGNVEVGHEGLVLEDVSRQVAQDVSRCGRGPGVAREETAPILLAELVLGVVRREPGCPRREAESEVPFVRVQGPEVLAAPLRVDPLAEVGPSRVDGRPSAPEVPVVGAHSLHEAFDLLRTAGGASGL